METRTIWWIRHGPTHAKGMVGWSDLPADLGDTEALERLSAELPEDVPIVSSDLTRASATADAIQANRLRLRSSSEVREMHFGDWELRTHAQLEAEDPEKIRAFWEEPGSVRPPGGESWDDMSERVERHTRVLTAEHKRLIVVAHFGVILSQVQRIGKLGNNAFAQRIDPLSLTQIDYAPNARVVTVNHTP